MNLGWLGHLNYSCDEKHSTDSRAQRTGNVFLKVLAVMSSNLDDLALKKKKEKKKKGK